MNGEHVVCDRCERVTSASRPARPVEGIRTRDKGSATWRPFLSCCGLVEPRRARGEVKTPEAADASEGVVS